MSKTILDLEIEMAAPHATSDWLTHYAEGIRPCFDQLQESIARLAGLLVQTELVRKKSLLDTEARVVGLQARDEARAMLRVLNTNAAGAHVRHHLHATLTFVEAAWDAFEARRCGLVSAADPLPPLSAAWTELQVASRCLPGLETVDPRASCCSRHGGFRCS